MWRRAAFGLSALLGCWLSFFPLPVLPPYCGPGCAIAAEQILSSASTCDKGLFLATFNIQNFGVSKAGRSAVMRALAQIIARYDIVAVEELSQKPTGTGVCGLNTMSAVCGLQDEVNAVSNRRFGITTSPRIGDEQYAIFFDTSRMLLDGSATYPDPDKSYVRPPHAFRFLVGSGSTKLTAIVTHTNPKRATLEIDNFPAVLNWTKRALPADFTMLVGDFNADGSYFKEDRDWPFVLDQMTGYSLRTPNDLDTTVAKGSNTYDRIIANSKLQADPAEVFVVEKHIDLAPVLQQGCKDGYVDAKVCAAPTVDWVEIAKKLSDHYPVEMCISQENIDRGLPVGGRAVATRAVAAQQNPIPFPSGAMWRRSQGHLKQPCLQSCQSIMWKPFLVSLNRASRSVINVPFAALIGFLVSTGITLAIFSFRSSASFTSEGALLDPFLTA